MRHQFISSIYLLISVLLTLVSNKAETAVLVKDKMWPKDQVLNVVFLDGTEKQKALVAKVAPLWVENSSLQMRFYNQLAHAPKETHIRVSFLQNTGSMLGNHEDFTGRLATLQLKELTQYELHGEMSKRYVLHEFGHALGLEHEYRNPSWPFGEAALKTHFNKCIERLSTTYSDEETKHNHATCDSLNSPLTKATTFSTIYDRHSIMNYPQTIRLADQSQVIILAKSKLSTLDKLAIERWYGKSSGTK